MLLIYFRCFHGYSISRLRVHHQIWKNVSYQRFSIYATHSNVLCRSKYSLLTSSQLDALAAECLQSAPRTITRTFWISIIRSTYCISNPHSAWCDRGVSTSLHSIDSDSSFDYSVLHEVSCQPRRCHKPYRFYSRCLILFASDSSQFDSYQ